MFKWALRDFLAAFQIIYYFIKCIFYFKKNLIIEIIYMRVTIYDVNAHLFSGHTIEHKIVTFKNNILNTREGWGVVLWFAFEGFSRVMRSSEGLAFTVMLSIS